MQVQRMSHDFTICLSEPCYRGFNGTIRSSHLYSTLLSIKNSSSLFLSMDKVAKEFRLSLFERTAIGEVLCQFPKVCSIEKERERVKMHFTTGGNSAIARAERNTSLHKLNGIFAV